MRSLLWSVGCGAIAIAAGCSSAFSAGSGGSGTTTAGTSSSSGNGSSSGNSSSSSSTTSSGGTGGKGTGGSTTTTTVTGTTTTITTTTLSGCPNETGAYSMTQMGAGCGDLDTSPKECIKSTGVACEYSFVAEQGLASKAVEGTVTVGPLGDFANGTITEGSGPARTGCVGVWKPGTSAQNPATMTIDCGGVGTSQSCRVILTRTGDVCPF
jgi:hypothetical protein